MRNSAGKWLIVVLMPTFLVLDIIACSGRQVLLRPVDLTLNQTVIVSPKDDEDVSGIIVQLTADEIIVLTPERQVVRLNRTQITKIKGPEPIFDSQGMLITEQEIAAAKNNLNLTTHAVFGGLISLGVGLFSSSLLSQELHSQENTTFITAMSALYAGCGGYFFSRSGAQKDREVAIEKILKEKNDLTSEIIFAEEADDKLIKERIKTLIREQEEKNLEIDLLKREIRALDQK